MNINNKSNNINNQNLIINERNNLNIYYNASKLINNNIINYDKISSSSDYLFSNQHIPNSNKVKGKNNNIENNKLKEIIKNVNNNINKNKKENIISLTNNKIKSNINNITKNIKNIKQMNPKEKNINKNINYKSIPNKKSNNNLYKKFPKNNNIINKKGNQNLNKRSSSQINNKFNQHINKYNNGEYIYSDKRNINNIGKYKNDLNCGRNHYMKNKNETEDSDYYINYLSFSYSKKIKIYWFFTYIVILNFNNNKYLNKINMDSAKKKFILNPDITSPFSGFSNKAYFWLIFGMLLIIIYLIRRKFKAYWPRRNKMKAMAEEYERKRESRNDLKFHYYWAIDRGEMNNARSLGQQILLLDHELRELYDQYQFYKKNGYHQLKKI